MAQILFQRTVLSQPLSRSSTAGSLLEHEYAMTTRGLSWVGAAVSGGRYQVASEFGQGGMAFV